MIAVQELSETSSVSPESWDGFLTDDVSPLSPAELGKFAGKRVLITGAGGYLGSALARALYRLPVACLVLLDIAEYGLYRLEQDLNDGEDGPGLAFVVGSVRDEVFVRDLFREHQPEIVIHAAALKHVPLMESNALAAADTNILGTLIVAESAIKAGVESFLFLSTDKAVEPISIMGATKRVAEQLVLSLGQSTGNLSVLRLCNVLGSTGSVAPLFARQIAAGGPVTVTDRRATRYFISRDVAVRHLLCSVLRSASGALFVPVAGAPRRVEDLATYLLHRIEAPNRSVNIVHTGLRISDKLHERLIAPTESVSPLKDDSSLLAVRSLFEPEALQHGLSEIRSAVAGRRQDQLLRAMQHVVPEYRPQILSRTGA